MVACLPRASMKLLGLIELWASSHDGSEKNLDIVEHCMYITFVSRLAKKIRADEILGMSQPCWSLNVFGIVKAFKEFPVSFYSYTLCNTQVKIDGHVRARYIDGPVTGPLTCYNGPATGPLRARYKGPV